MSTILNEREVLRLFTVNPVFAISLDESVWLENLCTLLLKELSTVKPNRNISLSLLHELTHKTFGAFNGVKHLTRSEQIAIHFKHLVLHILKKTATSGYMPKGLRYQKIT